MTFVMDIKEDFLKMMGWAYLRLDGGTKTEERASFVQMFNARDSEYKVSSVEMHHHPTLTRWPGGRCETRGCKYATSHAKLAVNDCCHLWRPFKNKSKCLLQLFLVLLTDKCFFCFTKLYVGTKIIFYNNTSPCICPSPPPHPNGM